MAKTRVLVDGFQFLRPAGTGIASYVRTLSTMLRSAGSEVSVLYGERYRPRGDISARAAATSIFSREPPVDRLSTMLERAAMGLGFMTGRGYRAQPVPVDTSHVDLSAIEPPLPGADEILNANRIFTRASCGFRFMGRFTRVARPIGCKLDVAHWTAPLPIRMRGVPNIYTIHDLIPLRLPHFVIGSGHHTFRLHEIIAREADHIITVSEASKRDIVELLGVPDERITVTYQPVPHLPNLDQAEAERLVENVYGIEPKQYALFLGAIEPKKNIKGLVEAFASADLGIPLLLAGPLGWLHDADLDLINVVNRARQTASIKSAVTPMQALVAMSTANALVHQLGYLPRQHVVALLKVCKVLRVSVAL